MQLDYNILNILILFGAIQGFILCGFLYQKRKINHLAVDFFLLFLFSLSFYNLMYAFLDMNLFRYHRPLHLFPYPFKWLIGAGFYFYIKNQFKSPQKVTHHIKEWYLLAPAFIYLVLRIYWFSISVRENSYRITGELVDSGFFRIQELFILFFNFFLLIACLKVIKKHSKHIATTGKVAKAIKWLTTFTWFFLMITVTNIILFSIDLVIHEGQETFMFIYPLLVINAIFIYWIGFKGFVNPSQFFNSFNTPGHIYGVPRNNLEQKLDRTIKGDGFYKKPNVTLGQLAEELGVSSKELSKHINEVHQMNFSEFLNFHRIERVKELLVSKDSEKYTLVTLAENAGFSSKSSFNASFKKVTGLTPSAYKKRFQNK